MTIRHRSIPVACLALVLAMLVCPRAAAERAATPDGPIRSVRTDRPLVALTFDDGPREPYTSQILDILAEQGVRATFFLIGENVRRHPDVVRRIVREGHAVGNHSDSHRSMQAMSAAEAAAELRRAGESIRAASGVWPGLFRPPYGAIGAAIRGPYGVPARQGLHTVLWSVEVQDWATRSSLRVAAGTLRRVRPGSIVLLHDGGGERRHVVTATRWMVGHLARRGYYLVTVPELLEAGR